VRRFEAEFAAYCGTAEAVACANGTDALELALWGIGVGPGDEVITVANTFAATAAAIVRSAAAPRFIDVDPQTLLMDVRRLAGAVVTSDLELADRMRQMRDHGRAGKKYEHTFVGRNSRMDGLQGAILRLKLRHLDAWNERRREIAARYRDLLADVNVFPVKVP